MGLLDFVKSEARQMAIARPDNMKHLIVYKHQDETISKWSQLTVDSDEGAVFFKEGRVAGILGAGRHTLDAATYPFLTGLVDKYAGGDIFKSEVFFVRTQPLRNSPVKFGDNFGMTDPVTRSAVRPRVHGEIVVRVMDPVKFIIGLTGQATQVHDNNAILQYVQTLMKKGLKNALPRILKEAQLCILEIDLEREKLEAGLKSGVPDLNEVGLAVTEILDWNLKLTPQDQQKVEKVWNKINVAIIEKRAELEMRKMEIELDVSERQQYVNMAQNPAYMAHAQAEAMLGAGQGMAQGGDGAGLAGMGAQLAVGMGMAGAMNQGFAAPQYQRPAAPPPGQQLQCTKCGGMNAGGKFCSNCGGPLAPPQPQGGFCSNCGNQLAAGAKFCANCGQQQAPPAGGAPPQGGPQGGPPPQGYPPAPAGAAPQQGYPPAQQQQQGYPPAQQQQQGYPQAPQGQPQQGQPQQGQPQQGQPQQGQPQQGQPQQGYPQAPGGQYAQPQQGYPPAPGQPPGGQGGGGGHHGGGQGQPPG